MKSWFGCLRNSEVVFAALLFLPLIPPFSFSPPVAQILLVKRNERKERESETRKALRFSINTASSFIMKTIHLKSSWQNFTFE